MGLGLFRVGCAVLPPWRQCGMGQRWRRWRARHWVRGGGPPRLRRSPLVCGVGACEACPPPTWWPLAAAAVESAGWIVAAAERGCSGPLRCG